MTVALDSAGASAARPAIEAAAPEHPSLIDEGHVLGELLGVVNVPSGTWIDEEGRITRPPESASPDRGVEDAIRAAELPAEASARQLQGLEAAKAIRFEPERYVAALRDWVEHGAASRFALGADEVIRRSRMRSMDEAIAVARFELGRHLHALGAADDAIPHFREAMRLQPDDWTYRRQAYAFLPRGADARAIYGSDWLDNVLRIGPESYYPPMEE